MPDQLSMKRLGRKALSLLLMVALSLVGILVTPPVAFAAFPTIPAGADGFISSTRASNAIDDVIALPNNVAAGDLLLVAHFSDGSLTRTFPSPWVEIKDALAAGPNTNIGVGYLIASGGETAVTVTKSATERYTALAFKITASTWHGTTPPEISTGVTGISANPDPDSVTASWGSADNLFFAIANWDSSTGAVFPSAWPANYTGNNQEVSNISSAGAGASGTRELAAASDGPGTYTLSASDEWWAGTIVVRPSGAPPPAGKPVRPPIMIGVNGARPGRAGERPRGAESIGAAMPRSDIASSDRSSGPPTARRRRNGVHIWPAVARWRGGRLSYDERTWT